MALGATVYKAQLSISDLDRNYYSEEVLTLARHPSETEARLMLRVLAFCFLAGNVKDRLSFGRGLSTEGEPALWEIDDTGAVKTWVELGTPDVRTVRKAAGKSDHVVVVAYDEPKVEPWWRANSGEFGKLLKLTVAAVPDAEAGQLAGMCARSMKLAVTIQDGTIWVSDDSSSLQIDIRYLQRERSRYE